jgi:hypothetical protein
MAQIVTVAQTFIVQESYQDVLNKWKANAEDFFDANRLVKASVGTDAPVYAPMTIHGAMVVAVLKSQDED